jgi:O-antigen ligase
MYLLFLIFIKNINVKYLALISILLIFILSSIVISPSVSRTFEYAINRISTLESIVQGDLTAEGTLSRITDRSPRVLDKFSERPLTGFGFSNEYSDYADVHVGNETLLLKGGIIGYFFMLLLMFNFNIKLFKRNVILTNANPYKKSLYIFIIGFIGFFIIHSSSGYIFNYGIDFNRGMAITVIMLFTFADRVYKESKYHQKYKSCN